MKVRFTDADAVVAGLVPEEMLCLKTGRKSLVRLLWRPMGVWYHWPIGASRSSPCMTPRCACCDDGSTPKLTYYVAVEAAHVGLGGKAGWRRCSLQIGVNSISDEPLKRGDVVRVGREVANRPLTLERGTCKDETPLAHPFDVRLVLQRLWGVGELRANGVLPFRVFDDQEVG